MMDDRSLVRYEPTNLPEDTLHDHQQSVSESPGFLIHMQQDDQMTCLRFNDQYSWILYGTLSAVVNSFSSFDIKILSQYSSVITKALEILFLPYSTQMSTSVSMIVMGWSNHSLWYSLQFPIVDRRRRTWAPSTIWWLLGGSFVFDSRKTGIRFHTVD